MIKRTNIFHCEIICDKCRKDIFNENLPSYGDEWDVPRAPDVPTVKVRDMGKVTLGQALPNNPASEEFHFHDSCLDELLVALNEVLPSEFWSGVGEKELRIVRRTSSLGTLAERGPQETNQEHEEGRDDG